MPRKIPLKEDEHYSKQELILLLEQLKTDRLKIEYQEGKVVISEHEETPTPTTDDSNPVDPRGLKLALAMVWKGLGAGKTLPVKKVIEHMSWDNRWVAPGRARFLVSKAIELEYLRTGETEEAELLFDPAEVPDAPTGIDMARILQGQQTNTNRPPVAPTPASKPSPTVPTTKDSKLPIEEYSPTPTPNESATIPDRIKMLKPWVLHRLNNDKCNRHCRTDKNSQKCRDCWKWNNFTP